MTDVARTDTGSAPTAREGDLSALVGVFRRHMFLIIGTTAVILALVIVYILVAAPKYTAKTTIAFAPQKDEVGRNANQQAVEPKDSDVDTQVEALKSRDLALSVVNQFHLDRSPEFNPDLKKQGADAPKPSEVQEDVVNEVGKKLKVKRLGQTLLTEVAFTSKNPRLAADIANAISEAYVAKQLDTKNQVTRKANEALNGKLDMLRSQVVAADAAVQKYRSDHNLLGTAAAPLSQEQLSLQAGQLAQARGDEAQASARYAAASDQIAKSGASQDVSDTQGSQAMSVLLGQRAEAARRVAELQANYGPLYPDLIQARKALAEVDAQIQIENNRVLTSLHSAAVASKARTASIASSNDELRNSLINGTQASVQLDELQRVADAAKDLYNSVLTRAKETSVQQAFAQADVRIDTPAVPPTEPSSPNVPVDIFVALVLGLGLGSGLALAFDRMTRGLSTSEEVEQRLGAPFLASIPTLASSVKKAKTSNPLEAIAKHPFSNFAESFRTLGTALRHGGPDGDVRTILLTSALPNEGKTTTALCLARVFAIGGLRVLFMDCDLRRRSANDALKIDPQAGLIEVLDGRVDVNQVIMNLPELGFDVLPLAKGAHLSKSPFETQAMADLLRDLKTRYDVIVLDTAPVLPVVDTRVLAQLVDAVAVLARWRTTPAQASATALRLLQAMDVEIKGVALTQMDLKAQARSGGSADAAYYYKAYEGYYLD